MTRRNVTQKAKEANSNPFIGLANKVMNIIGSPALVLAVAGWIYHGIEDTKTQVKVLQNTVEEQHAGTAGEIQQLRDGIKSIWQAMGKMAGGGR